jgi:hypothetical protein
MNVRRSRACAYCGQSGPTTKDHVPPKGIFPKPRPADLITVPACPECHSQSGRDDEYLRLILACQDLTGAHQSIQRLQDSVVRGLTRSRQAGLLRQLQRGTHKEVLFGPRGEPVIQRTLFMMNRLRIDEIMRRIVRGLYFHETGTILPSAVAIDVLFVDHIQLLSRAKQEAWRKMLLLLSGADKRLVGAPVFSYHLVGPDPEGGPGGGWLLTFYERAQYLVVH